MCAMLGLVMTVAVAWCITLANAPWQASTTHHIANELSLDYVDGSQGMRVARQLQAFGKSKLVVDVEPSRGTSFLVEEFGFPLRCLRRVAHFDLPAMSLEDEERVYGSPFPSAGVRIPLASRVVFLPILLRWHGFMVNILSYGSISWMVIAVFSAYKQRLRTRNGRCCHCGYALCELPRCPECGSTPTSCEARSP